MKNEPWEYAVTALVLCLLAVPTALFLLVLAALLLCLCPFVALVVFLACRATKRAERRKRYGGPVDLADMRGPHPVETCPCGVCACRREYLYGNSDPIPQA